MATFCFHPSPLSIDSLNLFKNAVTWLNANSEFEHKQQEHIRLLCEERLAKAHTSQWGMPFYLGNAAVQLYSGNCFLETNPYSSKWALIN